MFKLFLALVRLEWATSRHLQPIMPLLFKPQAAASDFLLLLCSTTFPKTELYATVLYFVVSE